MIIKRLYFAGPLFTQAEWIWNATVAEQLRASGFDVILPQEGSVPMLDGAAPFDPQVLFETNRDSIRSVDAVVAVLDQSDADSGTCWECGYAYGLGKPVIGVRTDIRSSGDDGALNLMLSRSCRTTISLPLAERSNIIWLVQAIVKTLNTLQ